jgi:release factor glutamine methyltransferase
VKEFSTISGKKMTQQLTITQCLKLTEEIASVSDTARLDIELLLSHLLQKNRTWLFTWPDHLLTEKQTADFLQMLARRKKGEPVAHIIGQREFWSLSFYVDNSTLIPRPDTELLVEVVLELFSDDAPECLRQCLDLGTGTGAIALALASEKKSWRIMGFDQSPAAIELAEKNRQKFQLQNVELMVSDWFSNINDQQFDVIVSNPPYIDHQDPHLSQGDLRFEPLSALVAQENGLADIKNIINCAKQFLAAGGYLLLEHGYNQAQTVRQLFIENGYSNIETRQDLGGNDRVTYGRNL